MLKVYTSNIVTSQKICKRHLLVRKIRKSLPLLNEIIDLSSAFLFLPLLVLLLNSYYHEFMELDYFKVKNIEFRGLNLLDEREGFNLLSLRSGINIFQLNSNKIKERFAMSKVVDRVQIKRKYPDTIILNITEKKPFIQVLKGGKYYVFDENFSLLVTKDTPVSRTVCIKASIGNDFFTKILKNQVSKDELRTFFSMLSDKNLFPEDIVLYGTEIDDISLRSEAKKLTVRLGNGGLSEKIKRYKKFSSLLEQQNIHDMIIDIRFEDMIIVKNI